jgi:branched-subunit amino acid transport protein
VSDATVVIAGCAIVTFAIKAAGPVLFGGRALPEPARQILSMIAPALLAALVAVSALADGERWAIGEDTAGVAVASAVYWRNRSIVACVLVAAVVTAALRAL